MNWGRYFPTLRNHDHFCASLILSAMPLLLHFIVVDFHTENRHLLARTLLRKYPEALIQECEDAAELCELVRHRVSAVIIHRTLDASATELVKRVRSLDATVPIVVVSSTDRRQAVMEAGATTFLLYDEWLRIGTVVEVLLTTTQKADVGTNAGRG